MSQGETVSPSPAFELTPENRAAYVARSEAYWARRSARLGNGLEYVQPASLPDLRERRLLAALPRSGKSWTPPGVEPSPVRFLVDGHLAPCDPEGHWTARETHTAEFRKKAKAESYFRQKCRRETGLLQDLEKAAEKSLEREAIVKQTHELCRRLERNGIPAYRSDAWNVWIYYVHSQEAVMLEKFRRICFLPAAAAALRQEMLRSLEHFANCHPFLRFWTFTGGKRCKLSQVRSRLKAIHRKISKLNAMPFMREAGVEIVFRSSELGTVEARVRDANAGEIEYENGEPMFHPHAHCVVYLRKGCLTPEKWSKLLEEVWAFWEDHWDDGKVIRDMREVCKYVTKPREVLGMSDKHLVALYHELSGLKLVQPMGTLKDEIKRRKAADLVLVQERTREGSVYVEVLNWNSRQKATEAELDMQAGAKLDRREGVAVCAPVARAVPGFNSQGIKEPRIVVFGNVWNAAAVETHPLVQRMIADTRDEYQAGRALRAASPIRVHTGTSTVRGLDFALNIPRRHAPPGVPVWENQAANGPELTPSTV